MAGVVQVQVLDVAEMIVTGQLFGLPEWLLCDQVRTAGSRGRW